MSCTNPIDLHTHSNASDGQLSPQALLARAADRRVQRLALTDHDTLAGLESARAAATQYGLDLINGVEISASWQKRTLHIVGLDIDVHHPELNTGLHAQQTARQQRAWRMVCKLERLGLHNGWARLCQCVGTGQITRSHIADLLLADGLVGRRAEAFKRYLRPGKPGYQRCDWAELATVIDWIHAAGGTAVLAHPFGYGMSHSWRRRMVAAFAQAGGDGLEICTGTTQPQQERQALQDAQRHGLAGSLGSDFHAPEQFWLNIGSTRPLPAGIKAVPAANI